MIFVRLIGGLGNQMFQYAAGRRLAEVRGTDLKLDVSMLADPVNTGGVRREYSLDVFRIRASIADPAEFAAIAPATMWQRRLVGKMPFFFRRPNYIVEPGTRFVPEILDLPDGVFLHGYWQNEKYFKDVEPLLRRDFTFGTELDSNGRRMAERILSTWSVCVHVRRGDYVNIPAYNTCGPEYYAAGARYLAERTDNPVFFVFSDDAAWCEKNVLLEFNRVVVPESLAGSRGEGHFHLMTLCRRFMIANSSFSWWAAWLGADAEKIVVAPKRWTLDSRIEPGDIVPDDWIRI